MSVLKWSNGITQGEKVISTNLKVSGITILVHHNVHCSPDVWFLSCQELHVKLRQLESRDLELAKLQSIQIISLILENAVKELAVEAGTANNELSPLDSCS